MSQEEIFEFEATIKVKVKLSVRTEDVERFSTTPESRRELAEKIAKGRLIGSKCELETPHAFGVDIESIKDFKSV